MKHEDAHVAVASASDDTHATIPVAIYSRSATNELNGLELTTQKLEGERFVAAHPDWTLIAHYAEYASGIALRRPQLDALLERVDAGDVKIIVVQRLCRLARGWTLLLSLWDRLDAAGVALCSVHDNLDTATISGRLGMHMFRTMVDFERNLAGDRVKAGLRAKRERDGAALRKAEDRA